MGKKKLVQITLTFLLFLIAFLIFNTYYKSEKSISKFEKIEIKDTKSGQSEDSKNIIQNIKYTSNNNNGDVFEILAEYGEPSSEIPDLMFLTNVTGNIFLKNKSNIKLTSDYANLNTQTFETTFLNNVKILRNDEIILGNELYLIFDQTKEVLEKKPDADQNLIRMSYNVVVKKPGYNLKADVLEIDLITKNLRIYMNDNFKKVKAKSKIN